MQEGLCVRVPCGCFYPQEGWSDSTPALGYWFREGVDTEWDAPVATNDPDREVQQETRGRFRLLGKPQDNNCSLDIRDARRSDSGTYVFRVERGLSVRYTYRQNRLSVRVTGKQQTASEATGEGWGSRDNLGGIGGNAFRGSEAGAGP